MRRENGIRVVHISSAHPPMDVRIAAKECRSLAAEGYDVSLVHRPGSLDPSLGIRSYPIPAAPGGRIGRALITAGQACAIARGLRADLYHLHDPELLFWAWMLRRTGKPVVFDMHENLPASLAGRTSIPSILRRPMAWLAGLVQKLLLIGQPVVLAENSYLAGREWVGPHAVVLNMPLIDELCAIPREPADVPTVGYVGAVDPHRGSLVTIDALALLARQGLHVRWECPGPAPQAHLDELKRLAATAGVDVSLYGRVPPTVGWQIMARCHAGLALLSPVPNYVSSYPTKMFEYMALRLPVVASWFPLYREIVEGHDCGIAVDPTDPRAIASAIRTLIENPDEARRMGENGRRAVLEHYNWENEKVKLLALYKELLG